MRYTCYKIVITVNKTIGNVSGGIHEHELRPEIITGLVVSETKLGGHKVMQDLSSDEHFQSAAQSI